MLPIRDQQSSSITPFLTWTIILINTIVIVLEFISPDVDSFIYQWSLVPVKVDFAVPVTLITFITSMFLHSGFWHFLSNMWFLHIFGDNVEAALGKAKFIIFYLAGGIIAALAQFYFLQEADIAILGASGAIAAVLGFYLVEFPHHRIDTAIVFYSIRIIRLPAQIVLGFWFITQLFNGTTTLAIETSASSGVAWWAHIGGFVFGVFVALIYRRTRT